MKRRPLTAHEQTCIERLRNIWDEKKKELGLTQEKAAALIGWSSQGSVAQYLTGRIPLNTDAILRFSKLLQVEPWEIDPNHAMTEFANIGQIRRRNLLILAEEHGEGALEQELQDILPSLTKALNGELVIGNRAARYIERELQLVPGSLDYPATSEKDADDWSERKILQQISAGETPASPPNKAFIELVRLITEKLQEGSISKEDIELIKNTVEALSKKK
ncbi:helix-turn-helix domain-containing protein [Microbulbifer sp. CnH-101-E]|uniref:helix-turn-helix domain-containing protein n=1 Tax=unclassified Microbulbifer TaxID=2619833 RepID=UPI00403A5CAF